MNQRPQFKRRNYFINKDFQGRYIFNYFILAAIGSILFIAVFSFFSSNTLSISYDNYHLQIGLTPGILFKKILSTQWVFIVLGGAVVVIVTLFLTHRVAGPFYRFEIALNEMIGGNISRKIILRQKDEGKDLAVKINAFNTMLADRLSVMGDLTGQIGEASENLKNELASAAPDMETARTHVEKILAAQERIRTIVLDYQLPAERPPRR